MITAEIADLLTISQAMFSPPCGPSGVVTNLSRKYPVQVIGEEYKHDQPSRAGNNCDDADRAAKMIQDALGIESDDVVNYCFPAEWPIDRERRARASG